jgi:hypothetical protein
LNPASRICCSKLYTFEHNIPICPIGRVKSADLKILRQYTLACAIVSRDNDLSANDDNSVHGEDDEDEDEEVSDDNTLHVENEGIDEDKKLFEDAEHGDKEVEDKILRLPEEQRYPCYGCLYSLDSMTELGEHMAKCVSLRKWFSNLKALNEVPTPKLRPSSPITNKKLSIRSIKDVESSTIDVASSSTLQAQEHSKLSTSKFANIYSSRPTETEEVANCRDCDKSQKESSSCLTEVVSEPLLQSVSCPSPSNNNVGFKDVIIEKIEIHQSLGDGDSKHGQPSIKDTSTVELCSETNPGDSDQGSSRNIPSRFQLDIFTPKAKAVTVQNWIKTASAHRTKQLVSHEDEEVKATLDSRSRSEPEITVPFSDDDRLDTDSSSISWTEDPDAFFEQNPSGAIFAPLRQLYIDQLLQSYLAISRQPLYEVSNQEEPNDPEKTDNDDNQVRKSFNAREDAQKNKRKRQTNGNGNVSRETDEGDEGDQGEKEDGKFPQEPTSSISNEQVHHRLFACPFPKQYPTRYGECWVRILENVSRVKQHLKRDHRLPLYCPRCFEEFIDEDTRDEHTRLAICRQNARRKIEGVTNSQFRLLGKRSQSNSEKGRWYEVFEILFPGEPLPSSPYLDRSLLIDISTLQEYNLSRGPEIIDQILQSQPPENLPQNREELGTFIHAIFPQVFATFLNDWNRGATSTRGSRSHLISVTETQEDVDPAVEPSNLATAFASSSLARSNSTSASSIPENTTRSDIRYTNNLDFQGHDVMRIENRTTPNPQLYSHPQGFVPENEFLQPVSPPETQTLVQVPSNNWLGGNLTPLTDSGNNTSFMDTAGFSRCQFAEDQSVAINECGYNGCKERAVLGLLHCENRT